MGRAAGPIYQLDASAQYPSCASVGGVPVRLRRLANNRDGKLLASGGQSFGMVAYVRVESRAPVAPVRHEGITVWPVGLYTTALCGPEIDLLRESGAQVEVIESALYETGDPLSGFFATLWTARLAAQAAGNRARVECIKRMMNALIGKFSQWDWAWHSAPGIVPREAYAAWHSWKPGVTDGEIQGYAQQALEGKLSDQEPLPLCRWRSIGWHSQYEVCNGEANDSCPAVTAWVCSVARVRLWRWLQTCPPNSVLYYDTDSIWVNSNGYDALARSGAIAADTMGALRLVRIHDWVDFRGIKYYETDQGVTCAGVPHQECIPKGGQYTHWSQERLTDALAVWRAPRPVLHGYSCPVVRPYRHGTVRADGRVTPLELSQS